MRDEDGVPNQYATRELVEELVRERERITRMIGDLERSREVLDDVIAVACLPSS